MIHTTDLRVNRPGVLRETRVYEAACFNKHSHIRCKLTTTSVCIHIITAVQIVVRHTAVSFLFFFIQMKKL